MIRFFLSSLLFTAVVHAQTTIEHALGTTTFDAPPGRIVTLEYSFTDALINLGVTPAGITQDANPLPILDVHTEGVPTVGSRAQPNLEAIIALEPDLIIADLTRHRDLYEQLSRIAPTVVFNSLRGSYEDILAQVEIIGEIVGQADTARALVAEHREAFAAAAASVSPDAGGFVAGVAYPGGFTVHSSQSFIGSLLERLGRRNLVAPQGIDTQFELSLEGLAALNPSTIIIFQYARERAETPIYEWSQTGVWQSLEAVKNDRVYVFDRDNWTRARGLLALAAVLDEAQQSGLLADAPTGSYGLTTSP
jgi:ABC-type Fe3+-citrate transport system substrate-binding protein